MDVEELGSEGRPTKMRKVEHISDSGQAQNSPSPREAHGGPAALPDLIHEHSKPAEDATKLSDEANVIAIKPSEDVPLSKNQQKKLKRQQEWDAGAEARKIKRKERSKATKARRRERIREKLLAGEDVSKKPREKSVQLPVTFILDCDFDDLMMDTELKSLATQITRCYSDNRNAHLRAHLAVSSFGGKLKDRFDGVLEKHYESWKGIRFLSEDFVEVSEKAKEWMKGDDGGEIAGYLKRKHDSNDPEADADAGEVIYLSSDSDVTLEYLNPYSTYIIGGLVDKNRHKGICHRRAMDRGIKTAKLPIGDFLQMNSRAVLTTNHVSEIMLKWLELGDWGDAFMEVIPKRKGGTLRSSGGSEGQSEDEQGPVNQEIVPVTPAENGESDEVVTTDSNVQECTTGGRSAGP